MQGIDAAQQLAFVKAEGESVIRLPGPRLPRRFLTREDDRKAVEVGDNASVHGLIERKQACLMRQELADGDSLLALLRELRPVSTDTFLEVEPPARVGDSERHGGQTFGG